MLPTASPTVVSTPMNDGLPKAPGAAMAENVSTRRKSHKKKKTTTTPSSVAAASANQEKEPEVNPPAKGKNKSS